MLVEDFDVIDVQEDFDVRALPDGQCAPSAHHYPAHGHIITGLACVDQVVGEDGGDGTRDGAHFELGDLLLDLDLLVVLAATLPHRPHHLLKLGAGAAVGWAGGGFGDAVVLLWVARNAKVALAPATLERLVQVQHFYDAGADHGALEHDEPPNILAPRNATPDGGEDIAL